MIDMVSYITLAVNYYGVIKEFLLNQMRKKRNCLLFVRHDTSFVVIYTTIDSMKLSGDVEDVETNLTGC